MKRFRNPALLLAALLQVLPLCRTVICNPAVPSTFAIILRWAIGATAAAGAVDAVSGSSVVYFTSPTNATGNVGQFFTFTITLGGTIGSDPGAKINAIPLPPGLTNYTHDGYRENPPNVYGVISGVPTTPVTNFVVHLNATHPSYSGTPTTNLYLTMLPYVAPSPPVITNGPANTNIMAGGSVWFSVGVSNAPPIHYQWLFNNMSLADATNNPLALGNIRTNQAGGYSVIVTNLGGSTTSTVAQLAVSVPPAPQVSAQSVSAGQFVFSFAPVVGLTNSVMTNATASGATWNVLTNIPPPASATVITITNPITGSSKYFRVKFDP